MQKTPLNPSEAALLDAMMADMDSQQAVYRPGAYWAPKVRVAAQAVRDNGYRNFRSAHSVVGLSYADNPQTHYATQLSPKRQAIYKLLTSLPVVRDIIDGQCRMTTNAYGSFQMHQRYIAETSPEVSALVKKYDLSRSTTFGSENEVVVNGQAISAHYLELCQQMDEIRSRVDLDRVTSVFEIGGGFGTMAHILLQNFPNIKTYVYLDIPPNLFIGTQYLRSLYPNAVRDYKDLQNLQEIDIESHGNGPTIYCICPWQIERLRGTIDLFYNSHSFVEMTKDIVSNYARFIEKVSGPQTQYALVTYDGNDDKSLAPDKLADFFPYGSFSTFTKAKLFEPWRHNFYAVGKNKGAQENHDHQNQVAAGR
jgi:putative sugar O-methyltransferase